MKKVIGALVCGVVLQIAQSELLTLAVFAVALLSLAAWVICKAGERGVL